MIGRLGFIDGITTVIYSMLRRRGRTVLVLSAVVVVALASCGSGEEPVALFDNGDYAASLRIFRAQALAGDIGAKHYLGMHYYLGAGVERDFVQAAALFETAALAEYPAAQRNLGVMYLRGLGVKQNYHLAYGWMYQAYAGGNAGAKDYLVLMSDNITPNASLVARTQVREKIRLWAALHSTPSPSLINLGENEGRGDDKK